MAMVQELNMGTMHSTGINTKFLLVLNFAFLETHFLYLLKFGMLQISYPPWRKPILAVEGI
jgi:hypothetical protein